MTTVINGSSPSITFSDSTTQSTAALPLTGGTVTGGVNLATSSGNVGIGTASPARRLEITGSSDSNALVQVNSSLTAAQAILGVTSGSNTGFVGTITNNDFVFRSNNAERMRINSSGRLLLGTTNEAYSGITARQTIAFAGAQNEYGLAFRPDANTTTAIYFANAAGSVVGSVTLTATTTAYVTSSDYRLKENIAPMTGALATVSALKPVTYNWKEDGSSGQGFIAHELQEVVPECVTGEKNAVDADGNPKYQGIDTSFLVATLTAAIQELKAELDATKAEVELLKAK